MELLELSIKYIDIATQFQSLTPQRQSEFLEALQDEYPYTETPPAYGDAETMEDYNYCIMYGIIHIFYEEYENEELSSILENYIHIQYEFNPNSLEMLLHMATSLSSELQSLS